MTPDDPPAGQPGHDASAEATDETQATAVPDAPRRGRIRLPGPPPGPIAQGDSLATAGRKAMWPSVERLLQREAAIRAGAGPDALRKLRVATRRLRAALRVFRSAYPGGQLRRLRERLSTLADEAGAVRDLDLRLAHLDGWASEAGLDAAVEPLRRSWRDERAGFEAAFARRLDAPGQRRLLARIAAFVAADAPADTPGRSAAGERAVEDRTASLIWDAYERLRAYRSAIRGADLETLHAVRIEAKRVRYTLEFFSPLLGPDRETLLERLVALQDHLGAVNDVAVRIGALRRFLETGSDKLAPEEAAALTRYLAESERSLAVLRRGVGRVWRPITDASFAGRLGETVIVAVGEAGRARGPVGRAREAAAPPADQEPANPG